MEIIDENALEVIRNQLTVDPIAGELKWFLFRAALFSYKRDFLLRPFPPLFRKGRSRTTSHDSVSSTPDDDANKDFELLVNVAKSMPPLSSLMLSNDNQSPMGLSSDQMHLLAWVFDTEKHFSLRTVAKDVYEEIKKLTGQQHAEKVPLPDYIFRLEYDDESEARFSSRRGDKATLFAYHGSKVANFHSILRNGLRANLNQVSLYGEGTYLSPELSVSLNWSPMSSLTAGSALSLSRATSHSLEGVRLGCIAVCEVIDDPTGGGVARQDATSEANTNRLESGNSSGARRGFSDVPDRYILVKNDDLLRIRYIMAYVDRSSVQKEHEPGRNMCARLSAFCSRHRFWLVMLLYFLLLTGVGLANSSNFQWYVRRFWTTALTDYGFNDDEYAVGNFHHGYEDA